MNPEFWREKRVVVTGHTGFMGGWLSLWLHDLGANVIGLALPPEALSIFTVAGIQSMLDHQVCDIRDRDATRAVLTTARPDIVFHLAAQALVRRSYQNPIETFETNVLGTAHVLDAAGAISTVRAVVVITSDKCYDNKEWAWGYRESDPLGGDDPYSASKGCTELVAHTWRKSFFGGCKLATARAGNVIGGGDRAVDRLIPDLVRAFAEGNPAQIRNPSAVRPWQHVLEPLRGYLMLAERLFHGDASAAEPWNFGPDPNSIVAVSQVADSMVRLWGGPASWDAHVDKAAPKESTLLNLDNSKARSRLSWCPAWSLDQALESAVAWYKADRSGDNMTEFTRRQIVSYEGAVHRLAARAHSSAI